MKTYLLYADRDFDSAQIAENSDDLIFDMELDVILNVMEGGDPFIRKMCRDVLMVNLTDPKEIEYRQKVLKDFQKNREFFINVYDMISRTIDYRKNMNILFKPMRAGGVLRDSIKVMNSFIDCLAEVRNLFSQRKFDFESKGIQNLMSMIDRVITDEYVEKVKKGLNTLHYRTGVECSMSLSESLCFTHSRIYPNRAGDSFLGKVAGHISKKEYTFKVSPQDDPGKKSIALMKDRALSGVAAVMEEARDHILSFFYTMKSEMAFYLGCLNLAVRMEELGLDFSFPRIPPQDETSTDNWTEKTSGLYDLALAIEMGEEIVSNDIDASGKNLIVITGANQGGKTTYLRSRGQVQIMMQAGMFVAAKECQLHCVQSFYTHFKRDGNITDEGGLADELTRMDAIIDRLKPGSMIIFNESFTSTNEIEASRINMEITKALLDSGLKVIHVTHLYLFSDELQKNMESDPSLKNILFLRASREEDGTRSFKLEEKLPLTTGFARDIYENIFDSKTE